MADVKVFITPHAQSRMQERGGDPVLIAAAVRAAAAQVRRGRVAVDAEWLEVVPVVKFRPNCAVVLTVLPDIPDNRDNREVVHVS